jgi:hypothetical protein
MNKGGEAQKKAAAEAKKHAEELTKLRARIKEVSGTDGMKALAVEMGRAIRSFEDGSISAGELDAALLSLQNSGMAAGMSIEQLGKAMSEGEQEAAKLGREAEKLADDKMRKFTDSVDEAKAGLEGLFSQMGVMPEMAKMMTDGLEGIIGSANMAGIGAYVPFANIIIAGFDGAFNAYKDSKKPFATGKEIAVETYKGMYEGIFGTQLGGLLAKIDLAWSKPLIEMFGGLFGSNDLGTTMRRGFGSLFDEMFDNLPHGKLKLWVEGELKELDGIDTTVYESDILSRIDDATAGVFAGLGTAFEEMISQMGYDMEGFGGQISTILAENVGGSLNELQIMFEALGVSAEDLLAAIETAYLAGDITAKNFLASSAQIQELYTQGIPGAIGATGLAMQNLIDTGLTDGRHAMDSLGDISAEAAEKGITSFEALREDLIASGHTVEDVDKLFAAFGQNGIGSMEDLANITVQQTAGVVSSLEDMGFGFEKPIEKADELIKKLDELEGKKVSAYVDVYYTEHDKPSALEGGTSTTTSGGTTPESSTAKSANLRSGTLSAMTRSAYVSPALLAATSAMARSGGHGHIKKIPLPKDYEKESMDSMLMSIRNMVEESARYKEVLDELAAKTITQKEAGKELGKMYDKAAKQLERQAKLEAKLAWALDHRGKVTDRQLGRLIERLTKLGEKIENIGGGDAEQKTLTPAQQISAVMDAFKAGAISINRANELIAAIKAADGQGLEGFGDVKGALEAFSKAKTNQEIMAAMKNLGIEAEEAKMSMGELMDYMQDKNFKGVSQFFEAMGKKGFNTIDEYIKASDESLIELLLTMASVGFPFSQALTDVEKFSHELKGLPDLIRDSLKGEFELGVKVNMEMQETGPMADLIKVNFVKTINKLERANKKLRMLLNNKQRQSLGI